MSYFPEFFSVNYFSLIPLGQMAFHFLPYMVCHTWFFSFSLTYCYSAFLLALLLVGNLFCFCILYRNYMDGVDTILDRVFCWGLDLAEIFSKNYAAGEYCLDIIWITYLLNFFQWAFDIGQTDWWVLGIILSCLI